MISIILLFGCQFFHVDDIQTLTSIVGRLCLLNHIIITVNLFYFIITPIMSPILNKTQTYVTISYSYAKTNDRNPLFWYVKMRDKLNNNFIYFFYLLLFKLFLS